MSTQESPAGAGLVTDVADLAAHVGKELGHTEWREMTQERVNQFADVTDDHNFIHVDPERAKETPFGGTIAHGYLTLSMLAPISQQLLSVTDAKTSINYGTRQGALPGARCRSARSSAAAATSPRSPTSRAACRRRSTFTIEVKDSPKPALVAECLFRFFA